MPNRESNGNQAFLILIRHAAPEIVPALPPDQWRLSAAGREQAEQLAADLADYRLKAVITSVEPKAQETGQIVASRLGCSFHSAPGLHEHRRTPEDFTGDVAYFRSQVARLFEQPEELILGRETASAASARFGEAVTHVLADFPEHNIAIVTHGTVLSLYLARVAGIAPYPFWSRLGLPAFVVLSRPALELITIQGLRPAP